jgi:hypothetical protein
MFHLPANPVIVTIASFVAAVILTYLVRAAARRYGFVAAPKSDRWHKKPTAMYGGVAIFLTTILMYAIFIPKTVDSIVVMGSATILFLVGLIDDFLNIKPYQKLIGQLIGAAVVVGFGLSLPLTGNEIIDIWLTVFWLIGITNAVNLLDNMDGLSAGIAAIGAFSLAVSFGANDQPNELLFVAAFIGALVGFLVYNFNPASILWAIAALCSLVFIVKLGSAQSNRRAFAQRFFDSCRASADFVRADFRYHICHDSAENVGQKSVAGRARSYFASSRRARTFGTHRRFDALHICRRRGRSFLARQPIGNDAKFRFDRRFRRFFDDHRRLSFQSKSLRRTGRRTRAQKQRRLRFSRQYLV